MTGFIADTDINPRSHDFHTTTFSLDCVISITLLSVGLGVNVKTCYSFMEFSSKNMKNSTFKSRSRLRRTYFSFVTNHHSNSSYVTLGTCSSNCSRNCQCTAALIVSFVFTRCSPRAPMVPGGPAFALSPQPLVSLRCVGWPTVHW